MVGRSGRFDPVQETPVDDGLPRGGDRTEQLRGPRGIRSGNRLPPQPQPAVLNLGPDLSRHAAEESRLVQEWIPDTAVAPIQQGDPLRAAAKVAGLKIAMDQGIAEAAIVDPAKSVGQIIHE